MKKLVLSAAAVVVAVALIGPKIVSSQFSQGLENTVAGINQNPAYTATITSIQSAWFSSDAVVNVKLKLPGMAKAGDQNSSPLDYSMNIAVSAKHGPIITEGGFSLAWLHTHIKTLESDLPPQLTVQEGASIYELVAHTGLLGDSTYTDAIAAMEYFDADSQTSVSFSGMQGQGEFGSNSFKAKSVGALFSANVADVMLVDVTNFTFDMQADASLANIMSQGLYDSNSSIVVDSINVVNNVENSQTNIQNIAIKVLSILDEAAGKGNVEISTSVNKVEAKQVDLSQLLMSVQLNNLEIEFLKAYQALSTQIMNYASDPEKVAQATNDFMQAHLLSQLQAEPEYNISVLSGKINGSSFDAYAFAKLVGVSALPATMEDPDFWLEHAKIDSKISMQEDAAVFIAEQIISAQMAANPNFASMSLEERRNILDQQVVPTMEALVKQGMLVATSDGYEVVFTLQNRSANLNTMPIPL